MCLLCLIFNMLCTVFDVHVHVNLSYRLLNELPLLYFITDNLLTQLQDTLPIRPSVTQMCFLQMDFLEIFRLYYRHYWRPLSAQLSLLSTSSCFQKRWNQSKIYIILTLMVRLSSTGKRLVFCTQYLWHIYLI